MKHPSPSTLAVTILAIAAIVMSGVSLTVLATTPVARLHSESANAMVLNPVGSNLLVNETFPAQSSVAFHWNLYGLASTVLISTVDEHGNAIYGQAVNLSGNASGSGSFVSEAGNYAFEFSGLTYAVAEVSLVITYTYLTQSPLI